MSSAPKTRVMLGVNTPEGLGFIVPYDAVCDMGDHGRIHFPTYFHTPTGRKAIFSYSNPKTGRVIYREIEGDEDVE